MYVINHKLYQEEKKTKHSWKSIQGQERKYAKTQQSVKRSKRFMKNKIVSKWKICDSNFSRRFWCLVYKTESMKNQWSVKSSKRFSLWRKKHPHIWNAQYVMVISQKMVNSNFTKILFIMESGLLTWDRVSRRAIWFWTEYCVRSYPDTTHGPGQRCPQGTDKFLLNIKWNNYY